MKLTIKSIGALALAATLFSACDEEIQDRGMTIAEMVVNDPNFSLLRAAATKAGLADELGSLNNITVFAPDNAAFARSGISEATLGTLSEAQAAAIVGYHAVAAEVRSGQVAEGSSSSATLNPTSPLYISNYGQGIFINGNTQVQQANIIAENGVIHVVDRVLMAPTNNIVQIAQSNPNFSILVAAVVKTGLAGALSQPGSNLTVFAPVNSAFQSIGITESVVNNASGAALDNLRNTLLYHVVGLRRFSTDFPMAASAPTLFNNRTVMISPNAGTVKGMSNNIPASITTRNIFATNGVVHVINKVLLP